ncbi:Mitochondrial group I intron splicing factor CCM1 [[Candida] zeylanoides]
MLQRLELLCIRGDSGPVSRCAGGVASQRTSRARVARRHCPWPHVQRKGLSTAPAAHSGGGVPTNSGNSLSPIARTDDTAHIDYLRPSLRQPVFARPSSHNPLLAMSQSEIVALPRAKYIEYLQIPYDNLGDTDQFCWNLVQIIDRLILSDARRAYNLLNHIGDVAMRSRISQGLVVLYAQDRIKQSIVRFFVSEGNFKSEFVATMEYIMAEDQGPPSLKPGSRGDRATASVVLNYLDILASVPKLNSKPILVSAQFYRRLFAYVPRSSRAHFFSCLVNINLQPYTMAQLNRLKAELLEGSNLDKLVVRTGLRNAKWHHTQYYEVDELHRRKMLSFYSLDEFAINALHSIRQGDVFEANLFMNLMVEKFELNCNAAVAGKHGSVAEQVQTVLHVLLNHIMRFKGPPQGLKILRYMVQNGIEVKFELLLSVLSSIRASGYAQEALMMMNMIKLDHLAVGDKMRLADEVILMIEERYPTNPKILIGYMAAFFQGCVPLMDALGVLALVYDGAADGPVQTANVDAQLLNFAPVTPTALVSMYRTTLRRHQDESTIASVVAPLYRAHIEMLSQLPQAQNDHVVVCLVKKLLEPHENGLNNLTANTTNYNTVKEIMKDFHRKRPDIKRNKRTVYLYDLLIQAALTVHRDYEFAAEMVQASRSFGVPFSFNQIYPFIMFHYSRNEFDQAENWYKQLVAHGVKSTAPAMQQVFRIARKLKWEVNGFVYRKSGIYKNYKNKEEVSKVVRDPFRIYGAHSLEDEVTRDILKEGEESDVNLAEELSDIMYKIGKQAKRPDSTDEVTKF